MSYSAIMPSGFQCANIVTRRHNMDMDDLVFYEVAMEKRENNAYLVTGNQKHYPFKDFIVTPAEMIKIMETGEKGKKE